MIKFFERLLIACSSRSSVPAHASITVRGNQRRKTFRSNEDYKGDLEPLEKYRSKFRVRIYAYCLMPNHVHLLLETGSNIHLNPVQANLVKRPEGIATAGMGVT